MRKSVILLLLLIISVASLAIPFGCANSIEQPAGQPVEQPAEQPAEKTGDQVFELTYSDWGPETLTVAQAVLRAIDKIAEKTNGNVKITPYFNATLVAHEDSYAALSSGISDIALMTPDRFRGVHIFNFLLARLYEEEAPSLEGIQKVYRRLLVDIPELQEELKKGNTIWLELTALPPNQLHTTKKPVKTPGDMKGMRLMASGDLRDWIELLGAAGVNISPGEWYVSLERGLADGHLIHWEAIRGFDTMDLFKYHTIFGPGGTDCTPMGYQMNLDTWNSLPPEYQDIIVTSLREEVDVHIKENEEYVKQMETLAEEKGHTFIRLTPEERQEWTKYFAEVNEKWINEAEKEGWPAREAYNHFMQLLKEYR